jgi:phosphatidylinositol alpha-1,6-mannosyltransferase
MRGRERVTVKSAQQTTDSSASGSEWCRQWSRLHLWKFLSSLGMLPGPGKFFTQEREKKASGHPSHIPILKGWMRVLLLTYEFAPFRGGIGRVAEGLAEGAVGCGLEPIVLAPDYGGDRRAEDAALSYEVRRFPGSFCGIGSIRRLVRFSGICRRAIAETRPDLVHGVDPPSQMVLAGLSRAHLTRAYIITVHGTELLRYRSEFLPHSWMRRGLARADAVNLVSDYVREYLHREFRIPRERTFVSHPGIARAWRETTPAARSEVRSQWGAGDDDFVILTIARVVREKGGDRVIAGLAQAPAELRARAVYVLIGTGPEAYAQELDASAAHAGIRLVRMGSQPDEALVRACDGADLSAMLSRQTPKRLEGLGLAYLEAGTRGVPSVACRTGGVAEAVLDGETGVLLPHDADASAVASAITRLAEDSSLRARLGANARLHGRLFTYERHAREVYGRAGLLS